jgi:signal transduction histidine kinase
LTSQPNRRRRWGTVRFQLAALIGGFFVVAGTAPLIINFVVAKHSVTVFSASTSGSDNLVQAPGSGSDQARPYPQDPLATAPSAAASLSGYPTVRIERTEQQTALSDQLLTLSLIAFAVTGVVGVGVSWLLAGRMLRPLREITATARRLSTSNLDERIGMSGRQDELKELADTFDAMLARLADAFDAQRRFAANASHELRTPLALQRAAVEVALTDPNPTIGSFQTMATRVHSATLRHEHLVDGLLMLARSERIEHYQEVDLAIAARDALIAAQPHVDALGLQVTWRLRPARLHGDSVLLERLAANLVDNAAHHNFHQGRIHVETHGDDSQVTLRVTNTGPMVAPEAVQQLLQPFRRSTPDRTRANAHNGHGLGLPIVAAITEAHQGTCAVCPAAEGGFEVVVTLPAGSDDARLGHSMIAASRSR